MNQEQNKYKFDNLQPITFLKKFNKMTEQDQKHPLPIHKNQLKIFPLSKFPLPSFYEQMQGIFQTGTKKKDVMSFHVKTKDQIADEEFLIKHRNFMVKAIQGIVRDNQDIGGCLEKYKGQYKAPIGLNSDIKRKSYSESKLQFNRKPRTTSSKNQPQKLHPAQKQPLIPPSNPNSKPQSPPSPTYLQKLQTERLQSLRNIKKQKIKIKDSSKLTQFLQSRHNYSSVKGDMGKSGEITQIGTARSIEYNDMTAEDWKKGFIQELLALQKEQSSYQEKYCDLVEGEIRKFSEKVRKSVQKSRNQMI